LHQYRPHAGVDLVARYGTPVRAVADGKVAMAGWCGELGRCVRIFHDNGLVSVYGHLAQIRQELHQGADVQLGQVIGQVGSSGLSTGPHLHYGLEKDGRYIDPLTATIGANHQISPRMRDLFERFKSEYLVVFRGISSPRNHRPVSRTLPATFGNPAPGVIAIADSTAGGRDRELSVSTNAKMFPTAAKEQEINGRRSIMR
jgi:murein DD-endopeptidase MepM/ murein hydrolase activator NlpD